MKASQKNVNRHILITGCARDDNEINDAGSPRKKTPKNRKQVRQVQATLGARRSKLFVKHRRFPLARAVKTRTVAAARRA